MSGSGSHNSPPPPAPEPATVSPLAASLAPPGVESAPGASGVGGGAGGGGGGGAEVEEDPVSDGVSSPPEGLLR